MEVKAATVTIEIGIDVDTLEPSFGVQVQVHDSTFRFIGEDPELLPTWLHGVAKSLSREIAGGRPVREDASIEPAGPQAAIEEMQRTAAERNRTAEEEAIASILGTTTTEGDTTT